MLKHRVWFLGCIVQSQELDLMMLMGPFNLGYSVIYAYLHTYTYIHMMYLWDIWAFQAGLQQLQIPLSAGKPLLSQQEKPAPSTCRCRGTSEMLLPRKCARVRCSHQEIISCRRFKQIHQTSLKRNIKSIDCFSAQTKGDTWLGAERGTGTRLCKAECSNFIVKWLQRHILHLWKDAMLFLGHSFFGNFSDI